MIISWNWLKEYVSLDATADEFARRLMMAGLNHESTETVGDDLAIDLEVTSNRPDCLGHIGIAREAAVLWQRDLKIPAAVPAEDKTPAGELVGVSIECPDLCSRYIARVIRGVRVGPSPAWMQKRLATLGIAAINNIVDISNYVLMECGQPLHTFDYGKLHGGEAGGGAQGGQSHFRRTKIGTVPSATIGTVPRIIVRRPHPGETIEAIDHKTYALAADTCVIADARVPVAIAGVMGGAATEVSPSTTAVLIESAEFDPISIRTTARRLGLRSDSSYRFERRRGPGRRRVGQPPLLPVDPRIGRRGVGRRECRRRPERPRRGSRSRCDFRNWSGFSASASPRTACSGFSQPWAVAKRKQCRKPSPRRHRDSAELAPRPVAGNRFGRGSRPHRRL